MRVFRFKVVRVFRLGEMYFDIGIFSLCLVKVLWSFVEVGDFIF